MRVLIVEDEKDMAQVLKDGLEEENHLVSLVFNGLSGFEIAQACEFDVIVLDVMLPKLGGFEVARRLRAKGNRTPILMLTARDTVPDVVKGLDLGADDYLQVLLTRQDPNLSDETEKAYSHSLSKIAGTPSSGKQQTTCRPLIFLFCHCFQ
jgi:DNA-binding response OmpR family regulator